uniref:Uncharacterized protein n=1 Tax=Mimivirus LCMiAC02 TaxID=2506609 RepID=A0A481Z331_9VIRU|nr:MAG: hypothetical protein LCMiAC02_02990 [Mimivirus LCMiAC02]
MYRFDFATNYYIFDKEESFSCVSCFKISEEVIKKAHIDDVFGDNIYKIDKADIYNGDYYCC